MKTFVNIFLASAVLFGGIGTAKASSTDEVVDVIDSKYRNLFMFKADRKFIGASVEVYYANGDLITIQQLEKRKMIIDFCDVKFGEYTIRLKKGNDVQEYHYVKK
ncbi:MAG: hypothetical protein KF687_00455 [Cyclobacteriaceae bacterium]|nr:hypothetical protein [Cyclobacteriaceae bacterium]